MTHQQEKAFNYIYTVADGYRRVLPLLNVIDNPKLHHYNKFYKDIRSTETMIGGINWNGWNEIDKLVSLFPNEIDALGRSWDFRDIKHLVFTAYKTIWENNNPNFDIQTYPADFNIDIQMFDAYLLSPNCFTSVRNIIVGGNYHNDMRRYNNIVRDAKIAYIRKIELPEWNRQDSTSKTTLKEKWYSRIKMIEQL